MAQTLESLNRKIRSAEALHSVVRTMRAIAAVNIRQCERAADSVAKYHRTVEMGLQIALPFGPEELTPAHPSNDRDLGAIIFGSDQGFVGGFNRQIVKYAMDEINALHVRRPDRTLLAVGGRVAAHLEDSGQSIAGIKSTPGSVTGITPLVQDLVLEVEAWRWQRGIERIILFYNSPLQGSTFQPVQRSLLPLDPDWLSRLRERAWTSRVLPQIYMAWDELFAALVREHLFVSLYQAFADSLASENASRLTSMQSAERNIEDRLEELNTAYHGLRQSSITAELLDVVSGFEALRTEVEGERMR